MIDQHAERSEGIEHWGPDAPVPAARPLSDFFMERVGDDVVLFDGKHNRYHTLNNLAFEVWQLCDGSRSIKQIGKASPQIELIDEAVTAAVAQLGESGLLQASEGNFESTMHRRRMMKLVAAGAIGAVGVPVVASITRLGPEASATERTLCSPDGTPCPSTPACCGCCVTNNRAGHKNHCVDNPVSGECG